MKGVTCLPRDDLNLQFEQDFSGFEIGMTGKHSYVNPDDYDPLRENPLAGYYTNNKHSTDTSAPFYEEEPELEDDGETEKVFDLYPVFYENRAMGNFFGPRTSFYSQTQEDIWYNEDAKLWMGKAFTQLDSNK